MTVKRIPTCVLGVTAGLFLATAASVNAQSLISNGDFSSGNLNGWSTSIASSGVSITYDASVGSGSAKLSINDNTTAPNSDYLYQIVPVTVGQEYQVSADWSGDLYNGSTGRNWAEVYLVFGASQSALNPAVNDPNQNTTANIKYKRATDGSNSTNPNSGATYSNPWAVQSITQSPVSSSIPANGLFTATDNYMLLAFNLGGHAGAGLGYYNVDNVSVVAVPEPSTLALLGLAGLGLGLMAFRSRRSARSA